MSLAGQRPFPRRKNFIFEALQFRRYEAFRTFQGLAPLIVVGNTFALAAGDLKVITLHAVITDLEIGNAAAGAFALLEIDEVLVSVFAECAQCI